MSFTEMFRSDVAKTHSRALLSSIFVDKQSQRSLVLESVLSQHPVPSTIPNNLFLFVATSHPKNWTTNMKNSSWPATNFYRKLETAPTISASEPEHLFPASVLPYRTLPSTSLQITHETVAMSLTSSITCTPTKPCLFLTIIPALLHSRQLLDSAWLWRALRLKKTYSPWLG